MAASTSVLFSVPTFKLFLNPRPKQTRICLSKPYPSPKRLTICASASKSLKVKKKVKSNAELCYEIREFLSSVGLPEDHVPSTKELLEHGRSELAYIVRRRGHKLLRELLLDSMKADADGFDVERSLAAKQDATNVYVVNTTGQDDKVDKTVEVVSISPEVSLGGSSSNNIDSDINCSDYDEMSTTANTVEKDGSYSLNGHEEIVHNVVDDNALSTNSSVMGSLDIVGSDLSPDHNSIPREVSVSSSYEEYPSYILQDNNVSSPIEVSTVEDDYSLSSESTFNSDDVLVSPANLSLEEKVAKFIQDGELDLLEDNAHAIFDESSDEESKGPMERDEAIEVESRATAEEDPEYLLSGGNAAISLNGSVSTSTPVASPDAINDLLRDIDFFPSEGLTSDDSGKKWDEIIGKDEQVDISELKSMLHEKELELTRLKEQIEMEKLALSALHTKAEEEISKVHELINEKDAELLAAEESLAGLQEVEILYSGDGEIVEVAGSFNGWHHNIKLDPHSASDEDEPTGSREPKLWSTVLWLYPGTYEIKFIVDGQWKTDPQRDSVTRGSICNNILKVG